MKKIDKVSRLIFRVISLACLLFLVAACTPKNANPDTTLVVINEVRSILALPDSQLEFVQEDGMINSPSGKLKVAIYQDPDGRKYSVDTERNRVVEIDARATLPARSAETNSLPSEDLEKLAIGYAQALLPDFDVRQSTFSYEASAKGNNAFFTWYGEMQPGDMNRPFLQFGLYKDGTLFAYYNTIDLND
jgi:hypothetical protein